MFVPSAPIDASLLAKQTFMGGRGEGEEKELFVLPLEAKKKKKSVLGLIKSHVSP